MFQGSMSDGKAQFTVSIFATAGFCRNLKRQKTVKMQTHNVKI